MTLTGLACFTVLFSQTLKADQTDPELDGLFPLLLEARNEFEAADAIYQIWNRWLKIDNSEVKELMVHGVNDMNEFYLDDAVEKFSRIIELAPNFAEGWNKRATAYFLMEEYELATADITRTLELEPRHFGALSGQGLIYIAQRRHKDALHFFKRAIAINPYMRDVQRSIQHIEQEFGQEVM